MRRANRGLGLRLRSAAPLLAILACTTTCMAPAHAAEPWPVSDEIDLLGDDEALVPPVDFDPEFLLAQAKDPSITTVDEMDTRSGGGSSSGSGPGKGSAGE